MVCYPDLGFTGGIARMDNKRSMGVLEWSTEMDSTILICIAYPTADNSCFELNRIYLSF